MVPEPSSAYLTYKKGVKLWFFTVMSDELIIHTMTTGIECKYPLAYVYYKE